MFKKMLLMVVLMTALILTSSCANKPAAANSNANSNKPLTSNTDPRVSSNANTDPCESEKKEEKKWVREDYLNFVGMNTMWEFEEHNKGGFTENSLLEVKWLQGTISYYPDDQEIYVVNKYNDGDIKQFGGKIGTGVEITYCGRKMKDRKKFYGAFPETRMDASGVLRWHEDDNVLNVWEKLDLCDQHLYDKDPE